MGIPVVSTRLGAEGMEVRDGENIMLADGPGEFVEKTTELLNNAELRQTTGKNCRRMVEDNFSWQKGVQILEGILERLI